VLLSVMTSALSFAACHQDTIATLMHLSVRAISRIHAGTMLVDCTVNVADMDTPVQ
jgi:hypothetical protein